MAEVDCEGEGDAVAFMVRDGEVDAQGVLRGEKEGKDEGVPALGLSVPAQEAVFSAESVTGVEYEANGLAE